MLHYVKQTARKGKAAFNQESMMHRTQVLTINRILWKGFMPDLVLRVK
jgi:hypothetical protein